MEFALLSQLSEDDRRAVLASTVRRRFQRGEVLFHLEDPGTSFHLLAKGRVAVRVGTPAGDIVTLTVLGPGEGFGEQALLSPSNRRTATVVALEAVETLTLDRADFDDLRARQQSVEWLLVDYLAEQVRRLTNQLVEALYLPAEKRLLRRVLDLDDVYGGGVIPLTQEDLATMAGTTRPTANRALQALVDDGLVTLGRGRLEVLDRETIARRAR